MSKISRARRAQIQRKASQIRRHGHGVEVGPFIFENSQDEESTSSTATLQGSKLVLTSTADWPMIVGMTSAWTKAPNS